MLINGWKINVILNDGSIKTDGRFYLDKAVAEKQTTLLKREIGDMNIGYKGQYSFLEKEAREYESRTHEEFLDNLLSAVDVMQRDKLHIRMMRRTRRLPSWMIVALYEHLDGLMNILGLFCIDEKEPLIAAQLLDCFADKGLECNISYEYYENWKMKQDLKNL